VDQVLQRPASEAEDSEYLFVPRRADVGGAATRRLQSTSCARSASVTTWRLLFVPAGAPIACPPEPLVNPFDGGSHEPGRKTAETTALPDAGVRARGPGLRLRSVRRSICLGQ
jgi:hypothetical protein